MLAAFDGLQDELVRDGRAADQFDDDIDVGVVYDFISVRRDGRLVADQLARALDVLVGDHFDDDAAAGAARDLFLVTRQHFERAAADRTDAEQAYVNGFHIYFGKTPGPSR